jgi:hypothetical protein
VTWIADLAPCTYFDKGPPASNLVAVGWLGKGHPVPRGAIAPVDRAALERLLVAPWNPFLYLGSHECHLCPPKVPFLETANLFVPAPAGDAVFAAPAMIGHYVAAHAYVPPAAFLEAVRACPEIGSSSYRLAMARHRPHDLLWCVGLLDAVPLGDRALRVELVRYLVGAVRAQLGPLTALEPGPRAAWAKKVGPLIAYAARALRDVGPLAREALDDLQRARDVLTEEPYAGEIAAALSAIRAG